MIKLNKKTEYALLALRYMGQRPAGDTASVKAVAAHYGIPETLLGKVLQALKRAGILESVKGASGGYLLCRALDAIGFTEILETFGEHVALVECLKHPEADCAQEAQCDIRRPIHVLNETILRQFQQLTVADLFAERQALSIYRHGREAATGTD